MRALVTGAAGFVGQWLCLELLREGWEVAGARLGDGIPDGALSAEARGAVRWVACDVTVAADLRGALDAARPDAVFHLAGIASVPQATADPGHAFDVNAGAAVRLLAEIAARRRAGTLDPTVLVVGSGEQYGRHDVAEQPLGEGAEQRPLNSYAASKAAQEVAALAACRADGVRVIVTRSFNHSGPGQSDRFVLPALVRRALALRDSGGSILALGNATPVRDFLHVADVARAYRLLAERGAVGEAYNVARGTGVDVATLAARVLALAGADARLQSDPALVRPVEVPVLVGSPAKLRAATGWTAEHSLDSIIEDLIRATSR
ncbi:MAG TPA: NAD-dependent epimerase/dehydratase family protein [Gemmatimonadaceae bacterium]|nr:NAD-dependent epimerase/dehydratase family protein [Gemmatimonadaceae bacterium]